MAVKPRKIVEERMCLRADEKFSRVWEGEKGHRACRRVGRDRG